MTKQVHSKGIRKKCTWYRGDNPYSSKYTTQEKQDIERARKILSDAKGLYDPRKADFKTTIAAAVTAAEQVYGRAQTAFVQSRLVGIKDAATRLREHPNTKLLARLDTHMNKASGVPHEDHEDVQSDLVAARAKMTKLIAIIAEIKKTNEALAALLDAARRGASSGTPVREVAETILTNSIYK